MRARSYFRALGLVFVTLLAVAFASDMSVRAAEQVYEVQRQIGKAGAGTSLCAPSSSEHDHKRSCSLCHLISSCDLPPSAGLLLIEIERDLIARVILPQMRRDAARPRDPATPARGPPAC
ncbi:hypothetical protein ERN12_13155 [Rhodobacteraceae bacterium]|nr:hypothetical protein ERN12_13155 [Paracoccaceae bacterium]